MSAQEERNQWAEVVSRARQDDAFKKRLLADPAGIAKEYGVKPPEGAKFHVVETPEGDLQLHVNRDALGELSEGELIAVAGGLVSCVTTTYSLSDGKGTFWEDSTSVCHVTGTDGTGYAGW